MAAMTHFVNYYTAMEYIDGRANRSNGIKRRGYMMIDIDDDSEERRKKTKE
jgi:hypothetical protein